MWGGVREMVIGGARERRLGDKKCEVTDCAGEREGGRESICIPPKNAR